MAKKQPLVRIFCPANLTVSAAVREDKVILVTADAKDESQDFNIAGNLTDEEGRRAFALVNPHAEKALLYPGGSYFKLVDYKDPERVELPMLWSFGVKLEDGYSSIRVLSEIGQTFNIVNGPNVGPISEGRIIGLYSPEPDNGYAIWKIVPTDMAYTPEFTVQ